MSFMNLYIYGPQYGWKVETTHGTEYLPDDVVCIPEELIAADCTISERMHGADSEHFEHLAYMLREYCEGTIESIEVVHGFFGRYSADGYMDCTDWNFDTDADALAQYLDEMYGDEEEESE